MTVVHSFDSTAEYMYSSRACALGGSLSPPVVGVYASSVRFNSYRRKKRKKKEEKKIRLGVSVRMLFRDGLEGIGGKA